MVVVEHAAGVAVPARICSGSYSGFDDWSSRPVVGLVPVEARGLYPVSLSVASLVRGTLRLFSVVSQCCNPVGSWSPDSQRQNVARTSVRGFDSGYSDSCDGE